MFQPTRALLRAGRIADAKAIAVLASPVRQELLDTIEALGGIATIAELAAQLGRPGDGLYYHVERLRRAGLLVIAPGGRSRAGRSERRYRTPVRPGVQLRVVYQPRDPRNASAVRGVAAGMLRIARRDFDRALTTDATLEGPTRDLWIARGTGWVSAAELVEINRLLGELTRRLRQPRGGARQRLISLCYVLAPITARPARRAPPSPPRAAITRQAASRQAASRQAASRQAASRQAASCQAASKSRAARQPRRAKRT